MAEAQSPRAVMLDLITGYWKSCAIGVIADLGVCDRLVDRRRTAAELGAELGVDPDALGRIMRALATIGVFERKGDEFALTALSRYLVSSTEGTLRFRAQLDGRPWHFGTWGALGQRVARAAPLFEALHGGQSVFDYLRANPDEERIYQSVMTANSKAVAAAIIDAVDFSAFGSTVVDVGGGRGELLSTILARHTAARGLLFDAPAVVAGVAADDRLRAVGGNFFESVPGDGDVYVLKHVLHDWADDRAVAILANVRRAMRPTGRLLVIELLRSDEGEPTYADFLDLEMMLLHNGRERSVEDYRGLLAASGFSLAKVHRTRIPPLGVIECIPG